MGSGGRGTAVKPKRAMLVAAMLALAALVLAGCGASLGKGDPSSPDTITLYNAQHEQTTSALIKAFTAKTGIHVRVKSDDESVLTAQIEQEGNRSPADVFFTENSNWLQQLDDRGMLSKVDASTLAHVPAAQSATNGDWVGVSKRFSVLIYNPSKISASQLPKTVMEMASPRYQGKLELAPGETDFWPVIQSIVHSDGKAAALKWLEGIKANAGSDANTPDNETLVSDVSKGLSAMGLINHYYYYRLRAEIGASAVHAKLAQFAPGDPGSVQDDLGRRDPEVLQAPGGRPEVPRVPHQRSPGSRCSRTARASSIRSPRGSRRTRSCRREQLSPQPVHARADRDRARGTQSAATGRADLGPDPGSRKPWRPCSQATAPGSRWTRYRRRMPPGWRGVAVSAVIAALLLAPLVLIALDARSAGWSQIHAVLFRSRPRTCWATRSCCARSSRSARR